jgi:hypothetical protein
MVIDEHHLRGAKAPARPIEHERPCLGCGYDLRGLTREGRCPECGLPISTAPTIDAPISEMPPQMVRIFRTASWLATACVAVLIVLVVGRPWLGVGWEVRSTYFLCLAVIWAMSVWMLTPAIDAPQAISRGFTRNGRLRRAARWLQLGWVLAAGSGLALAILDRLAAGPGAAPTPASWVDTLRIARTLGTLTGLAGVFTLGILLQRLAEWTCDREAEAAFNWAVWGIPLFSLLMFLTPTIFLVTLLLALLWGGAVCAFPYALLSLSKSLAWAVRHAGEHQDRLRRQRERKDEYDAEVADTIERMDGAREGTETTE